MVDDPERPGRKTAIVQRGEPYCDVEEKVRNSISEYFTKDIGRPELLNRFGDNIVVFDFISDDAARQIFDLQVANITRRVAAEHRLMLVLTETARGQLGRICIGDLQNGGRGIGNMLESALVNPLARALFDLQPQPGSTIVITGVIRADEAYTLTISAGNRAVQP
jgi:ATP-dependent Clp protease ATP-binding subunit ClpB